jgi:hypothetical protein
MLLLTYIYRIFRSDGREGHYSRGLSLATNHIFPRHQSNSCVLEWE